MIHFKKMLRRSFKFQALVYYLAFAMALITVLPGKGEASMVPTRKSVEADVTSQQFDRAGDMILVLKVLDSPNGKKALAQVGVTRSEMETYLGKLTDAQLNLVANKIRAQIPAGGSAEGVFWGLMAVLLILFIVFLILDITGVYKLPFRR